MSVAREAAERTRIPVATRDLAQAVADLQAHGMAVVEDALDAETLRATRAALYRVAAQDVARGRQEVPVRSDGGTQRIWNLPSRDPIFCDLVEHPAALQLVRSALGWPILLSNLSANITGPGTGEMMLHADQGSYPQPWTRPHVVNITWCLDDFTEANGATRVLPGSHLISRELNPEADASIPTVPVQARAGSLIAFDGRLWHKTGVNHTADQRRAGIFAVYCLPIYLPKENWFLSLDPSVRQFGSDTLLTLFGFKGAGPYGRVNGRPLG
jgi:ectoine hydroxylase-related dioxygenase (phytanoyl-CoA dioxygenase family)